MKKLQLDGKHLTADIVAIIHKLGDPEQQELIHGESSQIANLLLRNSLSIHALPAYKNKHLTSSHLLSRLSSMQRSNVVQFQTDSNSCNHVK